MALNVKVGLIGLLDMLKFKKQPAVRSKVIAKAPATPLPETYSTNALALELHPGCQFFTVSEIIDHSPDVKTYVLSSKDGGAAYFRAGQYLSVYLEIDGSKLTRPYSISSAPDLALKHGKYTITVKRAGFASGYILDNWAVGTQVKTSGPLGEFYYEPLRDAGKVVALAGGSGITPFMSMAGAVRDGREDFELTILYGSRTRSDIIFFKELEEIAAACPKVKVVHILSDEAQEGFENGFITAELIKKYAGEGDYSVFICGPGAMYSFLDAETKKLGIARKFIRRELFGATKEPWTEPGYPAGARDKVFKLTAICCGQERVIDASANESVLTALERAGVAAPSHCRSGECGYCHSRLISGEIFVPAGTDGRRKADTVYGYFHPCASFPVSDIKMELPAAY